MTQHTDEKDQCVTCATGIWCGDGSCSQWTGAPPPTASVTPPGEGSSNRPAHLGHSPPT